MTTERKIRLKCPRCGRRETIYDRQREAWVCLKTGCGWKDRK